MNGAVGPQVPRMKAELGSTKDLRRRTHAVEPATAHQRRALRQFGSRTHHSAEALGKMLHGVEPLGCDDLHILERLLSRGGHRLVRLTLRLLGCV